MTAPTTARVSPRDRVPRMASRLAAVLLVVILGDLVVVEFFDVRSLGRGTGSLVACVIFEAGIVALQVVHSLRRVRAQRPWWLWVTLPAQAGFTFLPMIWLGGPNTWGGFAGFLLAATALVVRPVRAAAALAVSVLVVLAVVGVTAGLDWDDLCYLVLVNILFGLATYAATWLSDLVGDLHEVRFAQARLAVERERTRFSHDLDDLLGYSLSAITLKTELANRLVATDPDAAKREIAAALSVGRQALQDVRSVARSYKELSLDAQVRSAETMLLSAGLTVKVTRPESELPTVVDTLLGSVVRESVADLLRSSGATAARITCSGGDDLVVVIVAHDGAPPAPADDDAPLRARLRMIGGDLSTGVAADGWSEVRAEAPGRPSRVTAALR